MSNPALNIAELSLLELEALLLSWGESAAAARRLQRWIWRERVLDFAQMENLTLSLRKRLAVECVVEFPRLVQSQRSTDGTVKHLLQLRDGKRVETVWIPFHAGAGRSHARVTLCVSSQVGCNMGCRFCTTAQQRVERSLRAGEIAAQLWAIPDGEQVSNIVFMGMGEPFDNFANVTGALQIFTDQVSGFGLGPKHITVSTSGLLPQLREFLQTSKARLAVSLNAPNDEIRTRVMPINRAYPLAELMQLLREHYNRLPVREGVTLEYVLLKDVNDLPEHAEELCQLVAGLNCKVNLILYNENPALPFTRPDESRMHTFVDVLNRHGVTHFFRISRGLDVAGACGQLASADKLQRSVKNRAQAGTEMRLA